MNARFERTGPLAELTSYPQWAQDMIADCASTKQRVLDHDIWAMMTDLQLDQESVRNFMMGLWPFIERFPSFMALNLLKTRYGRSPGDDMARRWLVRNIRVEQNHAEYWLNWAEGAGVPRSDLLQGVAPHGGGWHRGHQLRDRGSDWRVVADDLRQHQVPGELRSGDPGVQPALAPSSRRL
jgi:hypothetical protein